LLRKALPTGKRAARFSSHISNGCCRCQQEEDEIHLFFLCPFSRAAWFTHPWHLKSDVLVANQDSMHSIISSMLSMNHPYVSLQNVFTFLWCMWKARNDCLFQRKSSLPHQVHFMEKAIRDCYEEAVSNATMHQAALPDRSPIGSGVIPLQGATISSDLLVAGNRIYSDASWKNTKNPGSSYLQNTGLGVVLHLENGSASNYIMVQASMQ
jgi:hypothetical protein